MHKNCPKPSKRAYKATILHTLGVQVAVTSFAASLGDFDVASAQGLQTTPTGPNSTGS